MSPFRAWLNERGLSVPQVAATTGLGERQLRAVSSGAQQITRRQVERLVRFYGADPTVFGPVTRGPGRRWRPEVPS